MKTGFCGPPAPGSGKERNSRFLVLAKLENKTATALKAVLLPACAGSPVSAAAFNAGQRFGNGPVQSSGAGNWLADRFAAVEFA